MRYSLTLSEGAEADIAEAYRWYEQQQLGLGDKLIKELDRSFTAIRKNPEYFGFLKRKTRRCLIRTFPYMIIFFVEGNYIRVLSVFHTHRKPKKP